MELIITKNGHVYARARDEAAGSGDVYALVQAEDVPEYPAQAAGTGKCWELDYVDGALTWIQKDRELTTEERLERIETDFETIKYAWRAGEAVAVGDRRYSDGSWYTCIQAHTTQEDWKPALTPALWRVD